MNLSQTNPWLLPEGIEEVLPAKARFLESQRRRLVDLYQSWGYELVMPPFIEYLDSLLIGVGKDLELQTFTLTDQLSGRLMGIRADMTPQVARMDAHHLKNKSVNRLCYMGTVLRARPERLGGTRTPLQLGAEIYGHDGVESDVEIIELMVRSVETLGFQKLTLDIGNTFVFGELIAPLALPSQDRLQMLDIVMRKSLPDLQQLLREWDVPEDVSHNLECLIKHGGGDGTAIDGLRDSLSNATSSVMTELQRTSRLVELLSTSLPECAIHVDFAELSGYQYQTGTVFSVYADNVSQELARGGRYNNIGSAFGEGRPATGFSADLKLLVDLAESQEVVNGPKTVVAPWGRSSRIMMKIEELRAEGYLVVQSLPGSEDSCEADLQLTETKTGWELSEVV